MHLPTRMQNSRSTNFDTRIIQCLRWADGNGWGFPDALNDLYEEAKAMKITKKLNVTRKSFSDKHENILTFLEDNNRLRKYKLI